MSLGRKCARTGVSFHTQELILCSARLDYDSLVDLSKNKYAAVCSLGVTRFNPQPMLILQSNQRMCEKEEKDRQQRKQVTWAFHTIQG